MQTLRGIGPLPELWLQNALPATVWLTDHPLGATPPLHSRPPPFHRTVTQNVCLGGFKLKGQTCWTVSHPPTSPLQGLGARAPGQPGGGKAPLGLRVLMRGPGRPATPHLACHGPWLLEVMVASSKRA